MLTQVLSDQPRFERTDVGLPVVGIGVKVTVGGEVGFAMVGAAVGVAVVGIGVGFAVVGVAVGVAVVGSGVGRAVVAFVVGILDGVAVTFGAGAGAGLGAKTGPPSDDLDPSPAPMAFLRIESGPWPEVCRVQPAGS